MSHVFTPHSNLAKACNDWGEIPLSGFQPRRPLNLSDKKADCKGALATHKRFAASSGYQRPLDLQAHAALENYWQWQSSAQEACHLLIYGIDLGLSGDQLRPIYQETVALWLDAAAAAAHVRGSMSQHSGEDFGVPPPITTRGNEYRYAVILLALATLLDVQDEVPAIVEQVLAFDTDQLLDYLSAGALELQEVSETLFHKRPYGAMRPFFEQVTEALPDPLVPYLQTQYAEFLKLSPKQQKKGAPWQGTFYWALEVAALAMLYGWEDEALRASTHYPADLVDYARQQMQQAQAASTDLS